MPFLTQPVRGINPIEQKLLFDLWEKWITHNSKYKKQYNILFPRLFL